MSHAEKFHLRHTADFESGWTPLHRAFYDKNLEMVALLLSHGVPADVSASGQSVLVCLHFPPSRRPLI
jgi:ankyrin repeat protein